MAAYYLRLLQASLGCGISEWIWLHNYQTFPSQEAFLQPCGKEGEERQTSEIVLRLITWC